MRPIGKVTHYYGKPGVAIIELEEALKLGDHIRIEKNEGGFEQTVASLQKDYQPVEEVEAGESAAVQVAQKTKEGALVYRLEDGE